MPDLDESRRASAAEHGSRDEKARQDGEGEMPDRNLTKFPKLKKQVTLEDQQQRMPFRKLLIVYTGVGLALILSFMDQTSVSTAAPVIGTELHGSESIAWLGIAYYVSNCACHMIYGRLSDIFGRKLMLAIATAFLSFGNLLCGFAKTPVELYVFRAIAGMGGQGINSISMVVVSDIVSLKDRGKYQGLVAFFASLGNGIGPFIGGALAGAGHWPWVFWITSILGAIVIVMDWLILPLKPVHGSIQKKLRQIDYAGIFLIAAATVFLLVPVSGGGSTFTWKSPTVIAMVIIGGIVGIAFIIWEWRLATLPILPMRIFNNRNSRAVQIQSFLIGMVYYANIFYVPIYFQTIKGYTPFKSGCYVLAQTLPSSFWGVVSGFYISKTNHYKYVIVIGAIAFTTGIGLQIRWTQATPLAQVLGILQITALGTGWNFQTTLIAALATTATEDRAVVTSARNLFRTLGGAFGLTMANSIYNNRVSHQLDRITSLTPSQRATLLSSSLQSKNLPPEIREQVIDAYVEGVRTVFIAMTVLAFGIFICACFLKEVKFRKDSPELEAEKQRNKRKSNRHGDPEAGTDTPTELQSRHVPQLPVDAETETADPANQVTRVMSMEDDGEDSEKERRGSAATLTPSRDEGESDPCSSKEDGVRPANVPLKPESRG